MSIETTYWLHAILSMLQFNCNISEISQIVIFLPCFWRLADNTWWWTSL